MFLFQYYSASNFSRWLTHFKIMIMIYLGVIIILNSMKIKVYLQVLLDRYSVSIFPALFALRVINCWLFFRSGSSLVSSIFLLHFNSWLLDSHWNLAGYFSVAMCWCFRVLLYQQEIESLKAKTRDPGKIGHWEVKVQVHCFCLQVTKSMLGWCWQ